MKVSAIYIYPIKSLRGVSLQDAQLTPQGIEHDRRFMLRQVLEDGTRKNMGCYHFPKMVRFLTAIKGSEIEVTFLPTDGGEHRKITLPLIPDVETLTKTVISMHGSDTTGYEMGPAYNKWFTECFGFGVELSYVGQNRRPVLGNLSPNTSAQAGSWLQTITSNIPLVGSGSGPSHEQGLGLSDCAALLVVSETSLRYVDRSLPKGVRGDMTKFRPNIVVVGANEEFCEDYWRELDIQGNKVLLTQNCNRCVSLNLDYDTGDFAVGELGKVLAKLSKERRVDPGAKYSPVFGRYGFVERPAHGNMISVGDEVKVTGVNEERTSFYWPFTVPS